MAGLNQEMLSTACRAIYEMAGENYALPPLIRDAGSLETQPGYIYKCLVGKDELYFLVQLDEACADRNALANLKLPLKFHVELHDAEFQNPAVEITGMDKFELIRAFLLGAKLPISAEKSNEGSAYKVSVQLSSTFFVDCGEFSDEHVDCFFNAICDNVGRKIYERSKDFFNDQQTGVAVWSLLAAQKLFGEARPAPETLWPHLPEGAVTVARPVAANANERVGRPRNPRHAVAATIVIGLLGTTGVLTANLDLGEALTPPAAVRHVRIETAVLGPEGTSLAPAEANTAFGSLRPSTTSTMLAGPAAEHHIKLAQLQIMSLPSSAPAPVAVDLHTVSTRPDCAVCGFGQWSHVATFRASLPIPHAAAAVWLSLATTAQRAEVRSKWTFGAKPKGRRRHWRPTRFARIKRPPAPSPLKFARTALASLTSVVKDIGRIPDALSKAQKRLQIPL